MDPVDFEFHIPCYVEFFNIYSKKPYVREITHAEQTAAYVCVKDLALIFDKHREIKTNV